MWDKERVEEMEGGGMAGRKARKEERKDGWGEGRKEGRKGRKECWMDGKEGGRKECRNGGGREGRYEGGLTRHTTRFVNARAAEFPDTPSRLRTKLRNQAAVHNSSCTQTYHKFQAHCL